MKRFFVLIQILILIFAVISCGDEKKKDEIPSFKDQISKEIVAEEGGKIESADGNISIDIPAGALDENTTITMTVYDMLSYPAIPANMNGRKLVSKVVEFEPSGTIFKKPVLISMVAEEAFENKIVSAAVYYEAEGRLSYSEHGAYGVMGQNEAGDPIMMSAAGDPIMLSDGNMTTGAGDPIMNSAAGDPIMLAAAGDPIMTSAAGDPIMSAAAGDPIMMGAGHFTAYAFIALDPTEPEGESGNEPDENDEEPVADEDKEPVGDEDEEPAGDEDEEPAGDEDEISDEDENPDEDEDPIVPEPPKVYSKVLCTGQTHCSDGVSIIDCPAEGEDFYGQDSQFVTGKSCAPHKYTKIEQIPDEGEDPTGMSVVYEQVIDENTNLRWLNPNFNSSFAEAQEFCENLEYGGIENWRVPTVKELLSISDHGRRDPSLSEFYFGDMYGFFWSSTPHVSSEDEAEFWIFDPNSGGVKCVEESRREVMCVSGEKYGEVSAANYSDAGEVISDSTTALMWQKTTVTKTWKEALKYCNDLDEAGYTDWRLPNKNELITLVDFSKSNPASSFPGMPSEYFWTSTFVSEYGGTTGVYRINFEDGTISPSGSLYDGGDTRFVRCVRSDIDSLTGTTIPECNESRIAPCRDAQTGYVWSSQPGIPEHSYILSWEEMAIQCRELKQGTMTQWRIPTIDELRTLLVSSDKLKVGGECNVTTACSDYFDEGCYADEECSEEKGFESSLYDYGVYISGTLNGQDDGAWGVNMTNGSIFSSREEVYAKNETRCIYDESLSNPTFPYSDSANHLIWSPISKYSEYWYNAAKYCKNLEYGGSNNWRVPTLNELQTLKQNCDEPYCPQNASGIYSVFGDVSSLWSSTVGDTDNSLSILEFMTASVLGVSPEDYQEFKVRCVRSENDPENISITFPFEAGDGYIWSKISDDRMELGDAQQYCDDLNNVNYGERNDWRVPTLQELRTLIKTSVCGNKYDLQHLDRCNQYSFEGYSIFGDMVELASSDGRFDFAEGYIVLDSRPDGFVRCVVSLPIN